MGVERRGRLWQHDGKPKETGMEETELLLPREKMLRYGVTLLKDDELLALFLRT